MPNRRLFNFILLLFIALSTSAFAAVPSTLPALFDPARHMRVDEVRPGMTGYGLTVFQGTKIERFDVEVMSILRNFNPQYDVVLIRCLDDRMQHSGSVAGMSGSPIFLHDDRGHDRMIGAFAYGWGLMKDPIAGVQPIEYMLKLAAEKKIDDAQRAAADDLNGSKHRMNWCFADVTSKYDAGLLPSNWRAILSLSRAARASRSGPDDDTSNLHALATPLMVGGFRDETIKTIKPLLQGTGLVPLQAGGGMPAGASTTLPTDDAPLAPGSVLVAPMLTGDLEMSGVGTCTEVIGDRFFGFGHSMYNEGFVSLPAGSGRINAVIAKLDQSMKIGEMTSLRGAFTNDRIYGVGGTIGESPAMIPVEFKVSYDDGTPPVDFHAKAISHPRMTSLIAASAFAASMTSLRNLPTDHTIDYSLKLDFANGRQITIADRVANTPVTSLLMDIMLPMTAAADNPFEPVKLSRIAGTIDITSTSKQATLLYVNVPKLKYRPGETVNAFVAIRPFRAAESTLPIAIELPHDLPNGQYDVSIADATRYLGDEAFAEPFRFSAENANEVFDVLKDFISTRHDALYARIVRQSDGVSVGRVAMPRLPSSRREILLGSGRSDTAPFVSSTVKIVPTEYVMEGSADFQIEVDSEARVEVGGGLPHGTKGEPASAPPAVKADEERPVHRPKSNSPPAAPSSSPSTPGS